MKPIFCLLLIIISSKLFCLDSFMFKTPVMYRKSKYTGLVLHQTIIDTNVVVLAGLIISTYIVNRDINRLSVGIHDVNASIHAVNASIHAVNASIHAVNFSLSSDILSVRKDLQYLQTDNGFTVELTIRNNLAASTGLKYSEKYNLAGIPSLIAWFPVDKRFSTEKSFDQEYLITSRQRILSAFCIKNIDSLVIANKQFGGNEMSTFVTKTLGKFNSLSEGEKIDKLTNEATPLAIMILTSMVTDPVKEMERRNAIVYSSLDLDVYGKSAIYPHDQIMMEIGECKTSCSEEAVSKGCYQLALRLAVLANVAHAISNKSNGCLRGVLYFREGTRGASKVEGIIKRNVENIKAEIIFPPGFELSLDYEFI